MSVIGFKVNGDMIQYNFPNLDNKPDIDATPTANSTNAVQSGGVKSALDGLQAQIPQIDSTLSQSGQAADAKVVGDEISDLKEDLNTLKNDYNEVEPILENYFIAEYETTTQTNALIWTDNSYYDLNDGTIKSLNGYYHTEKFPCEPGDVIGIGKNLGQVLFWSESEYLSYVATTPSSSIQITAPENAAYYACNNRNSTQRATSSTVSHTTSENVLVEHKYNAPARRIYDSTDFVHKNYASTANGGLYTGDSYSTWYCAYTVPCKPNHKYRTKTQTQVVFYNASKQFISSYIPYSGSSNVSGAKVEMDFTTPANCEYISINSNSPSELVFDEEYTEYGNSKSSFNLIGKTIVCFGDSITGNYPFGDNYPCQIEEKTGAKVYDVGFGGCRMELTTESSIQYVNPFSMVSLANAIVSESDEKWNDQDANAGSFAAASMIKLRLDILKSIDFSNVDVAIIAYGTNGVGLPLDDENDPLNTYTYAGATRYAIKTLLTKYHHLRIVLLTPIYRWYSATSDDGDTHEINGQTLLDRVNKLIEVGSAIKIPTIDLYHTLGINKYNYTGYFGDDDETADGTHINSFGREQMGLRVAGELIRLF